MVKCSFCGREEHAFMGVSLIKNDGTVNYFCSGKCRKNAINLGRDKKKLKWTEAFHISREKALVREAAERVKSEARANEAQEEEKAEKKAAKKKQ